MYNPIGRPPPLVHSSPAQGMDIQEEQRIIVNGETFMLLRYCGLVNHNLSGCEPLATYNLMGEGMLVAREGSPNDYMTILIVVLAI